MRDLRRFAPAVLVVVLAASAAVVTPSTASASSTSGRTATAANAVAIPDGLAPVVVLHGTSLCPAPVVTAGAYSVAWSDGGTQTPSNWLSAPKVVKARSGVRTVVWTTGTHGVVPRGAAAVALSDRGCMNVPVKAARLKSGATQYAMALSSGMQFASALFKADLPPQASFTATVDGTGHPVVTVRNTGLLCIVFGIGIKTTSFTHWQYVSTPLAPGKTAKPVTITVAVPVGKTVLLFEVRKYMHEELMAAGTFVVKRTH
ncbi:MAG TPA: hypothetical protein VI322_05735 [Candidatus Saccharimonadia bacterium]